MSEEKTLGQLVAEVTNQMSEILRHEVELAKAELGSSARNGLAASGLIGAAGYLLSLAAVMLCVAGGYGLAAAGLSEWLAFLVVAGALVLLALLLGAVGAWRARRVGPPSRAAQALGATVRTISRRTTPETATTPATGASPATSPARPATPPAPSSEDSRR